MQCENIVKCKDKNKTILRINYANSYDTFRPIINREKIIPSPSSQGIQVPITVVNITEKPDKFTLAVPVKEENNNDFKILKLYGVRKRIEIKKQEIEPSYSTQKAFDELGNIKLYIETKQNGNKYLKPEGIDWHKLGANEKGKLFGSGMKI